MKKRTIALILAVLMLASVTPFTVFGKDPAPELETDAEGYLLVNEFDELYKHLDANRGQSFKTFKYRLNKDVSEWSNAKTLPVDGITAEIDLNGHTLDLRTYWGYTNLISVYDRGHLTIKDTSEAKTGVVTYYSDYAKHVKDEDIDDDDGSICAIYCNRDSTVEIYGGTYRLLSSGKIF